MGDFRGADSLDWSPDGKWLAAGNSGQLNFGYLWPFAAPRWQGTARHLPGFRRRRRRAATDCLEVESCRFEASLFARRPAPRVRLLRLFRRGHGRDAGLRCGSGRTRYVARHGAASPPADDAAVPVHLFPDMDAGRQRHHLRCRTGRPLSSSLWRVTIDGNRAPERIEDAGELATAPALARSRDRLAFTRMSLDNDIYRFEAGGPVQLVAGSSFVDSDARLSPDGRRLAFASARAGGKSTDIWIAEADGSNPQQLTHGPGVSQGSPSWSPDGRRIAFDARGEGLPYTPVDD